MIMKMKSHEEEAFGLLENSYVDSNGWNLGLSWVNDSGYWGFSVVDFDRSYGVPGHHHEEEHEGDEHDEGEDEHEHEEEEVVVIDLNKRTYNLKGLHNFADSNGFLTQLRFNFSTTGYEHVEFEGDEIGTVFSNDANETRIELIHNSILGFSGAFGLQLKNRDFSAIGDEAFILPSDTKNYGVFLIEEKDFDKWHFEFGLRYDYQAINTAVFSDISHNALSASIGANFYLNDAWSMPVHYSGAQRLPTAEELIFKSI